MKHSEIKDLENRILGNVSTNPEALEYFSTDQSIFSITPSAIVYPQNTADVRQTVQYAAESTQARRPMSISPRGLGSNQGGAALGEGISLIFPAHMNKLLRLDNGTVTVQPGILFETLQQTLFTHGRFIPQTPSGAGFRTVGGVVASGSGGEKYLKYGSIRQAVRKLKVVLADGSIIETGPLKHSELNRKKGLSTFEGDIYRAVDSLLIDHDELIKSRRMKDVPNLAGYDLWDIKRPNGFDLTQLFIGSQGTLGVITEITLTTNPYSPRTTLLVAYFDNLTRCGEAIEHLRVLAPSSLEIVDGQLLESYVASHPTDLVDLLPEKIPNAVLFVEFDNYSQFAQKLRSTRATRILRRHSGSVRVSTDPLEQVALWKLRRTTVASWLTSGTKPALPFIEDAAVPVENFSLLIEKTYKLLKKHDLEPALWGHAGSGNLRLEPRLDLSKKKDIGRLLTLSKEYTELVVSLGGTPSATQNDNLLRAASLNNLYGDDFFKLLTEIKQIFDPANILNPNHKTGATVDFAKAHLRSEFSPKLHNFHYFT